jgi:hypothetical protein
MSCRQFVLSTPRPPRAPSTRLAPWSARACAPRPHENDAPIDTAIDVNFTSRSRVADARAAAAPRDQRQRAEHATMPNPGALSLQCRSGHIVSGFPLRPADRFRAFADRVAQGRPDPTGPLRPEYVHSFTSWHDAALRDQRQRAQHATMPSPGALSLQCVRSRERSSSRLSATRESAAACGRKSVAASRLMRSV